MRVVLVKVAWEDYTHWASTDRKVAIRINRLIEDMLVYSVSGQVVTVVQARYHY